MTTSSGSRPAGVGGYRDLAAVLEVEHGDRRAPVALPRDAPVAQAELRGDAPALAALGEPAAMASKACSKSRPVELAGDAVSAPALDV
jgi:hypothetical protein